MVGSHASSARDSFSSQKYVLFLATLVIFALLLMLSQQSSSHFVILLKNQMNQRFSRYINSEIERIGKLEMARSSLLIVRRGRLPEFDFGAPRYPLRNITCKDYSAVKPHRLKICLPKRSPFETAQQEYLRLRIAGNILFERYVSDLIVDYFESISSAGLIEIAPGPGLYPILAAMVGANVVMVEESLENAIRLQRSAELSNVGDVQLIVAKILPSTRQADGYDSLVALDQLAEFINFKRGILKLNLEDQRACDLISNSDKILKSDSTPNIQVVLIRRSSRPWSKLACMTPTLSYLYKLGFQEQSNLPMNVRKKLPLGNLDRWFNVFGYILLVRFDV